jgi:hypothetical protein
MLFTIIIIIIIGIFLHLFYQFGHIILFSVELGNMSMFIAFHILLDSILILLTRVYFKFSSFITLQKVITNGNLGIIASYA